MNHGRGVLVLGLLPVLGEGEEGVAGVCLCITNGEKQQARAKEVKAFGLFVVREQAFGHDIKRGQVFGSPQHLN